MVPWQPHRHPRPGRQSPRPSPSQQGPGLAGRKRTDIAFLVAQLGAYAAERFGERAAALDFTRPQAGLLRLISREPGLSQQAVALRPNSRPAGWSHCRRLEHRGLIDGAALPRPAQHARTPPRGGAARPP